MDVAETIKAAVDGLVASGTVQAMLEERVEKMVAEVLTEALGRYSNFAKALKGALEKSIQIDDCVRLPSYNAAIISVIERQIARAHQGAIERQVATRVAELLQTPPERILLSELIDTYRKHVAEERKYGCVCHGDRHAVTVLVAPREYGMHTVAFAPDPDTAANDCDFAIEVNSAGTVYSLRTRDGRRGESAFAGSVRGFQRYLFALAANRVRLELDCAPENVDLTYQLAED